MFSNIHLFLWCSNTLQVGSVIRATVFIIAALTLMAKLFDYKLNPRYSWPIDIFLITVVVALMVIAGVCTVMTAYHESRKLCWVSFCFISCFLLLAYTGTTVVLQSAYRRKTSLYWKPDVDHHSGLRVKLYTEGWGYIHNSKLYEQWRNDLAYWWLHWWSNHLTNIDQHRLH